MQYISTRGETEPVGFREALFTGLAPDGGLFMPESIPRLDAEIFTGERSFAELAAMMIHPFIGEEIEQADLLDIAESAFSFPVPLVPLGDGVQILELFHGPTLAFKDFAARFMALAMQHFLEQDGEHLTILVATSGDTGGAVADAFHMLDGISVVVLYPAGRVSAIQRAQLTTLGGNVTVLEIDGSFDDCQRMVKQVFRDDELRASRRLSSANSINVGRLLPQSVYYAWAWKQAGGDQPVVFSVPCGNFGNLTAGILAARMGLPVERFIAATNANDVFPTFLRGEGFHPRASEHTLSNAMDVGSPSNLDRMRTLFGDDVGAMREHISSWSFTDDETAQAIQRTYSEHGYLADPHTAVGLLGLERHLDSTDGEAGIVLSTAHPAKFSDILVEIIDEAIPLPQSLTHSMGLEKRFHEMPADSSALKHFLLKS